MKHESVEGSACCPICGHEQRVVGWPVISKRDDPEATSKLMRGTLFEYTCKECGYFDILTYTCVYLDEAANAAVVFGRTLEDEKEAFETALPFVLKELEFDTCYIRWVSHADDLSEKARIIDCGLDDRAVEVAKIMMRRFLEGKDVLHGMSLVYFSDLTERGDLLFDVVAISDTANEFAIFSYDEHERISAELDEAYGRNRDLVIDREWAERFLSEATIQEAADIMLGGEQE